MTTISVSDEIYQRLLNLRKEGESIEDVLNRITKKNDLSKLIGILPKNKVEKLSDFLQEQRENRSKAYKNKFEGMISDNDR